MTCEEIIKSIDRYAYSKCQEVYDVKQKELEEMASECARLKAENGKLKEKNETLKGRIETLNKKIDGYEDAYQFSLENHYRNMAKKAIKERDRYKGMLIKNKLL